MALDKLKKLIGGEDESLVDEIKEEEYYKVSKDEYSEAEAK